MLVTAQPPPAAAASFCDDVLYLPVSDSYMRARLQGWILRRATRWRPAPLPANEASRLELVRSLKMLDSAPENRFDRITRIAAALFDAPIALISMIDEDRQWFKSACGLSMGQTPRDQAFCAHAIHEGRLLLVPDALRDDRFADNPLVAGPPYLRFYAGHPLIMADGMAIGTLCVMDKRARDVSELQLGLLADLAAMAVTEFETTLDLELAAVSP